MIFLQPLIFWLAKLLIEHFLQTNIQLKNQLADAVKHEEDLKKDMEAHKIKEAAYNEAINDYAIKIGALSETLHVMEDTFNQMEEQRRAKQKTINDSVDAMSDHDAVRAVI